MATGGRASATVVFGLPRKRKMALPTKPASTAATRLRAAGLALSRSRARRSRRPRPLFLLTQRRR
jgi:hypothetical protein